MKSLTQQTRNIRRWAVAAVLGVALLLTNVSPALAIGSSPSDPSDGLTQLDKIEQRSKDVLKNGPRGMEEVQTRAEGGLNGVQGAADRSKMSTPANSQAATSVMDNIKDALSDVAN